MPTNQPQSKPPPKRPCWVSPAERAWLDRIIHQLAYDEYMQGQRELWLGQRPCKEK